jgi:diaminohydroxyphosphoribosylaminopyrimidine deaminase/5-amino-6-(5-phosphoribosylamino)uracil reductase
VCGLKEAAARRLNESFIKFVRTGKPFVILKIASTLDGRIATRTGDARWVTGSVARAYVHQLRHGVDAIMVGVGTVEADDPELTTRLEKGGGVDPVRVVLDTRLRMSENARMLHQASRAPTWVVCGPDAPPAAKEQLEAAGATMIQTALKQGRIDLETLMRHLAGRGVTSLLIEGGAQVAGAALREGIVDKVLFFYAPKICGGDDGIPICAGPGPDLMRQSLAVRDIELDRMGDDIMVSGYLKSLP